MFHEDGTMRKSCKSDLVQQFENEVSPSPKTFMSACLFSLTDRNFFQSGIFLPSMTWNTFLCMGSHFGTMLSFSRLNGFFSEFFGSKNWESKAGSLSKPLIQM
jgi:hypothetical protein